jgi:hypothetical protein
LTLPKSPSTVPITLRIPGDGPKEYANETDPIDSARLQPRRRRSRPRRKRPRDHLGGFFLRLSAGVSGAETSIDDGGDELKFSGPGGDINIAIGGIVSPNLALHGTIFGWAVADPDVKINGDKIGNANADLSLSVAGIGLTYYFMPANLYLSGTVGFAQLHLDSPGVDGDSNTGLGMEGTFGKEWWVGNKWGLGIAGALGFHTIGEDGVDGNWTGVHASLRFTATLN